MPDIQTPENDSEDELVEVGRFRMEISIADDKFFMDLVNRFLQKNLPLKNLYDTLVLVPKFEMKWPEIPLRNKEGQTILSLKDAKFRPGNFEIYTTVWPTQKGIAFFDGDDWLLVDFGQGDIGEPSEPEGWQTIQGEIIERNKKFGLAPPPDYVLNSPHVQFKTPEPIRATQYTTQTSQEFNVLAEAFSNGRSGQNWISNPQDGARIYTRQGLTHQVIFRGKNENEDITALESLTSKLDADATFALMHIAASLAPLNPQGGALLASGWFDLDDMAEKCCGLDPRSKEEREHTRNQVYEYLRSAERAQVIGRRSIQYRDKKTGDLIDTYIEAPMLRIMSTERPLQPQLFGDSPRRVQIAMTSEWSRLMSDPSTAQFLPCGEILGSILSNKPGGAWARTIGFDLLNYWRRNSQGNRKPVRRELFITTPKLRPPEEILNGKDPKRAAEYWHSALRILVERGIVADIGEAKRTAVEQLKKLPRYEWGKEWLIEEVDLKPGPLLAQALEDIAANRYLAPPQPLAPKRRRGRPRKTENIEN
jgi:hypothetical protein